MAHPLRIQRKYLLEKLPKGVRLVARPSRWGNPYPVAESLLLYRAYLDEQVAAGRLDVNELRGLKLACYCPLDQACHADVLAELANTED